MADPLTDVSRRLTAALPGFRRSGRRWTRSAAAIRQEIRLTRDLRTTDGSGSIRFWIDLEVFVADRSVVARPLAFTRADSAEQRFVDTEESSSRFRWLFAGADEARLEEVTGDVRDAIDSHRSLIEATFNESHLTAVALGQRPDHAIVTLAALGHRDRVLELLNDAAAWGTDPAPKPETHDPFARHAAIWRADAVLAACALAGIAPPEQWVDYAQESVRSWRGRPPKNVRSEYDRVRAHLDASNTARPQ